MTRARPFLSVADVPAQCPFGREQSQRQSCRKALNPSSRSLQGRRGAEGARRQHSRPVGSAPPVGPTARVLRRGATSEGAACVPAPRSCHGNSAQLGRGNDWPHWQRTSRWGDGPQPEPRSTKCAEGPMQGMPFALRPSSRAARAACAMRRLGSVHDHGGFLAGRQDVRSRPRQWHRDGQVAQGRGRNALSDAEAHTLGIFEGRMGFLTPMELSYRRG